MTDFIQPLDLKSLLVTHLAGSSKIFAFLAIIVIATLAGRFRMNNTVTLIMTGLFAVLMVSFMPDIYFLALLIAGAAIFYGIGRLIKY